MDTSRVATKFKSIVNNITNIGYQWHQDMLLDNSKYNVQYIEKTIRELPKLQNKKEKSAIVVSAGPSLHNLDIISRIKNTGYKGTLIAIDGSYIRMLKHQLIPDYTLTLDPHPTRIVRWFGDPNFEDNLKNDDYFDRQDLDVDFRNNTIKINDENIALVDRYSSNNKLIICSTAPRNIVERCADAKFDMYWWAPLVDDPNQDGSLTKKINNITDLPCMNTGGTVGTAAWVFCKTILGIDNIAAVGMDMGYYSSTPYSQTQTFYELQEYVKKNKDYNIEDMFPTSVYPQTNVSFYTDPTFYWYRQNLLDLVNSNNSVLYNCTGAGTLFGNGVTCCEIEDFIKKFD
jgi:hypothetical protein